MSEKTPNLTNYQRHLLSIKDALKPTVDPSTGEEIDLVLDNFNALSSTKNLFFDYRPFETVLTPDVLPLFVKFLNKAGLKSSIPEDNRTLIKINWDSQEDKSETKAKAVAATKIGLEKVIDALLNQE